MIFDGLMSRWTSPCSWAHCSPRAVRRTHSSARQRSDHHAADSVSTTTMTADDFRQVQPLDELHDDDGQAVDLPGVISLNDVGMGQLANGQHLALEAGHGLAVASPSAGEDFDGHDPIELRVQGLVDPAHAAAAQFGEHSIFPQHLRHRGRTAFQARRLVPHDSLAWHADSVGHCGLELWLGQIGLAAQRHPQAMDERVVGIGQGQDRGLAFGAGPRWSVSSPDSSSDNRPTE